MEPWPAADALAAADAGIAVTFSSTVSGRIFILWAYNFHLDLVTSDDGDRCHAALLVFNMCAPKCE